MHPSPLFLKHILTASVCAAALLPALAGAASYQHRVNLQGLVVSGAGQALEGLSVALATSPLPDAIVGAPYSYDFKTLASSNDPDFTSAQASFSATGLPAGLSLAANGVLTGNPTTPGSSVLLVKATYKSKEALQTYALTVTGTYSSCRALLTAAPGTVSGWYALDVDGPGPVPAQSYYCDMSSDGGGWTRIVRQYEDTAVPNWTGGVNGTSYVLAGSEIPQHTHTAFGKDDAATYVDYVPFVYTTGDISKTLVTSPKTGLSYHIHRSQTQYFGDHDPESASYTTDYGWQNTLSFDRTGGVAYSWSFSPNSTLASQRGFALSTGTFLYTTSQSYAWTVWVR